MDKVKDNDVYCDYTLHDPETGHQDTISAVSLDSAMRIMVERVIEEEFSIMPTDEFHDLKNQRFVRIKNRLQVITDSSSPNK